MKKLICLLMLLPAFAAAGQDEKVVPNGRALAALTAEEHRALSDEMSAAATAFNCRVENALAAGAGRELAVAEAKAAAGWANTRDLSLLSQSADRTAAQTLASCPPIVIDSAIGPNIRPEVQPEAGDYGCGDDTGYTFAMCFGTWDAPCTYHYPNCNPGQYPLPGGPRCQGAGYHYRYLYWVPAIGECRIGCTNCQPL